MDTVSESIKLCGRFAFRTAIKQGFFTPVTRTCLSFLSSSYSLRHNDALYANISPA
ncbi:hypothetical protein KCP70_22300 [Salmonella enterica subsp. enterica]|nr:hypothetical protein KCP70_22300 [Salmonella enterica subsp. enterica]